VRVQFPFNAIDWIEVAGCRSTPLEAWTQGCRDSMVAAGS